MTLSIAAWDETSGQPGAAISSSSISVSSRCLHWRPGVGIALSQHITDPRLGQRMLSLLADGVSVGDAVDATVRSTPYSAYRQLALIDQQGGSGTFTGWEVYAPQINDYVTRALEPGEAPVYGVPGDP